MFRETLMLLQKEHASLMKELERVSGQVGRSYETGGGWHDNPDWLNLLRQQKSRMQNLATVRQFLHDPKFIEDLPPESGVLPTVRPGMCAKTLDIDTQEMDVYGIVGAADLVFNPRYRESKGREICFASVDSPLAQQLLGKTMGEMVTLMLPRKVLSVMILSVFPIVDHTEETEDEP